MMTYRAQDNAYQSVGFRVFGVPLSALAILLGIAAVISAKSAHAQPAPSAPKMVCAVHEKMTEHLGATYTEAPRSLRLAADGKVLEVFSTEGGETWTMVVTAPEGMSCIVAAGKYWQHVPTKPKGPEV